MFPVTAVCLFALAVLVLGQRRISARIAS
jgi:hypothetical protein